MIKIIKDGAMPKKTKIVFKETCDECGCEFEFELEDFVSRERRLDGYGTILCPCCNKIIKKKIEQYEQIEVEDE
ncbi:MAG: hypothetical protein IKP50_03790 [Bacilli bacterium]|nr:hypothetical protein [Bacilli bacterium]